MLLRFAPMIYGPTVLFALGEGAVIPLIPVIAAELGADVAAAALVASALVVGQLCGNLPAGWAVARFGERLTMAAAGILSLAGVVTLALAPSLGVFAIAVGHTLTDLAGTVHQFPAEDATPTAAAAADDLAKRRRTVIVSEAV